MQFKHIRYRIPKTSENRLQTNSSIACKQPAHWIITLMYRWRKRAVRLSIWYRNDKNLKHFWHSVGEPVRKSFINERVKVKSNECMSCFETGQASTPYSRHGKHFDFIKLRTTSSEAALPTFPKTKLNERKKNILCNWETTTEKPNAGEIHS